MNKYTCPVCGYSANGDNPPTSCPKCGVSGEKFIKTVEAETASNQNHCSSCGGELEKDGNVYICKHCGEVFKNEYAASSTSANMTNTPDSIARELLNTGYQDKKLEAIKILRERTGLGLKEAKEVIERVFASAGYGAYTPVQTQKNGGCYVATCVYGSYDCPQVWTLRRYRDFELSKTWYGRAFIHTYYTISPTIVKWFGNTTWFKKLWRSKLDKMVRELNNDGVLNMPYEDRSW